MRMTIALPILLLLPASVSAQIAPKSEPAGSETPIMVRIEPVGSGTYELERAREVPRCDFCARGDCHCGAR